MQTNELDQALLRRLAELKPGTGKVLSLYLNLDPSEFATGQARATAIASLIDSAEREVNAREDIEHGELAALREDVERADSFLRSDDFDARGAQALAVFCSGPNDLFEVLKLPRPVESQVAVDDSPFIEPLAQIGPAARWCVLLVNRRIARILRGSREGFSEVARIDSDTAGQHDQGGWSQARYERAVEQEKLDHLKAVADTLFRRYRRSPFDHLLVGCPEALWGEMEGHLHAYLKEPLVGRIDIDVENSTADHVRRVAEPAIDEHERRRQDHALDRVRQGIGTGGTGAGGLEDVLRALNEQRVEILLYDERFSAPGIVDPRNGWIGPEGEASPVDGGSVERRGNIVENVVETALMQSAQVMPLRDRDDLEPYGGIAAVLRW
jgi:peptide chain release factor subunit 1